MAVRDCGRHSLDSIRAQQPGIYWVLKVANSMRLIFAVKCRWRFRAKRSVTSSATGTEQALYFTSVDNTLYALDPRNGWVLWRFRLGKASISSPCFTDDMVFVGASDGFIYAVETRSSKEVWRFRTEHQVNGSPVIYKDFHLLWISGWQSCIVWSIVQDVYAGNSEPREQLQAHHWYMMTLCISGPPITKSMHCLPEKEFLWINFFAGYLGTKSKHQK